MCRNAVDAYNNRNSNCGMIFINTASKGGREILHIIKVESFGPISSAELSITDTILLIGEQASGKSTLAKLVYFCRALKEEYVNLIFKNGYDEWSSSMAAYFSILRKKFTNVFGLTKDLGKFKILYTYSPQKAVTITPSTGNTINFRFSDQLIDAAASVWNNAKKALLESKQSSTNMYASLLSDHAIKQDILNRC